MSQVLSAPSGIAAGATVILPDGTSTTVDADGNITVADNFVGAMLNAGFNFAATDPGSLSNAISAAGSNATSSGLADSQSRSSAGSAGAADSQSRSAAGSAGLADSQSRSSAVSAGLADSVSRSAINS